MKWRWDQGRLKYFNFINLITISKVLSRLDNIVISNVTSDPLRTSLEENTGLPFSPSRYRVWRNYKRVFECSMLATGRGEKLYVSDLCKKMAAGQISIDDYLLFITSRFCFPFPAFSNYQPKSVQIFPFLSILKLLIGRNFNSQQNALTVDDVMEYLVANEVTGIEDYSFYTTLAKRKYNSSNDEKRQIREMLIFISQLSFLEWTGKKLILDVMSHEKSDVFELVFAIQPYIHSQKVDRCEEFKVITNFEDWHENDYIIPTRDMNVDYQFTEGKRVRVSHLRIERSPSLRRRFFENYPDKICDMCSLDSDFKYPWVDNILELHHILPLSSSIRVESYGTLLEDIRPLCPSCHRGTHIYYRKWLEEKELYDFRNKKEAWDIYTEAKEQVK